MYRYYNHKKIKPGTVVVKTIFAFLPTRLANNKVIFWKHYTEEYKWSNHNGVLRDFTWIVIHNTKEIAK